MRTAFTDLVGCDIPIQLAPVGGPDLVVAVAEAGGLGMLAAGAMVPAEVIERMVVGVAERAAGSIGINFLMPFLDRAAVSLVAPHVRVVEFFYDDPDPSLVDAGHEGGALVTWQAGSVDEAKAAADAGCDFVVIQGTEAGGHVRGEAALLPILIETVDAIDVPVVAAGGIATGRAMAAALAAGASAVRIGTLFLATPETEAHPEYVEALIAAGASDTVLTEAFSVFWPNAPHRVLRSCVERAESLDVEVVGEFAIEGGGSMPIPRFAAPPPQKGTTGDIGAMALYAGQGVGAVTRVRPAADIVAELCEEAERALREVSAG